MDFSAFLQAKHIPFEQNVDLKKKTWIHRGGVANYYISPTKIDQLVFVVKHLYAENCSFLVVGHTSNLYIRNTTNIEIVISTIHLNHYEENDGHYICECGVAIADLSRKAIKKGKAGYEGLVNLPGTVASAVVNNASCFQCGISNLLVEATILCTDGEIRVYDKEAFEYSERSSAFKRGEKKGVILSVTLDSSREAPKEKLLRQADANTLYRKERQEGPKQNLGSTYPNYVMKAFYEHLPIYTRLILILFGIPYRFLGKQRPQIVTNTIILLCSLNYIKLYRYVSKHNFGCFIWRDEKADEAFKTYYSFVAKTSGLHDIEIEIL